MSTNDGGPAFPSHPEEDTNLGMSLRDWFAGMVMQGYIVARTLPHFGEGNLTPSYDDADFQNGLVMGLGAEIGKVTDADGKEYTYARLYAEECYELADALIAEREKKP